MNINKMDVMDFKILAYDLLASREQTDINLRAVNQAIASKTNPKPKEKPKDSKKELKK